MVHAMISKQILILTFFFLFLATIAILVCVAIAYVLIPKNYVVLVWIILPPLFFPAVWAAFGMGSVSPSLSLSSFLTPYIDWKSDRWSASCLAPAGVALILAILSSPLLSGLHALRNTMKKDSATLYFVHEYECALAVLFGLLAFALTKGTTYACIAPSPLQLLMILHRWCGRCHRYARPSACMRRAALYVALHCCTSGGHCSAADGMAAWSRGL